jgi:NDP-sugar pyrophosphorylase family protein
MSGLPSVCILAGGRGTRLGDRVANIPKPMLEVAGKPFLFHQLSLLADHGAHHIVLCVGYLGEVIEARVGTERYGLRIDYSYDSPGLDGTLGAVRRAIPLLGERFLVLYGDTYLRLDYAQAVRFWERSSRSGLMCVLRNEGRWDTSNVLYADGRVLAYDKRRPLPEMRWIDYGLGGLHAESVAGEESDLAGLYHQLAERGELCGYEVRERFYEIGRPAALQETEAFLKGDSVESRVVGA